MVGIQGQLWSETLRTPEQFEQMIYPRVIALAERAWHKADWEADKPNVQARLKEWADFSAAIVTKELPKMAASGSAFYLPPPGAIIQNRQLLANAGYVGLAVEYSVDQGATWQPYKAPVAVSVKSIHMCSRLGDRYSRVTKTK